MQNKWVHWQQSCGISHAIPLAWAEISPCLQICLCHAQTVDGAAEDDKVPAWTVQQCLTAQVLQVVPNEVQWQDHLSGSTRQFQVEMTRPQLLLLECSTWPNGPMLLYRNSPPDSNLLCCSPGELLGARTRTERFPKHNAVGSSSHVQTLRPLLVY